MKKLTLGLTIIIYALTPAKGQITKIWDKTYGGCDIEYLSRILSLPDKGFLLAGTSSSPVGGNKSTANYGMEDYWIVRLDSNGDKLWEGDYGGIYHDFLYDVITTKDGGFLLCGGSGSPISGTKTQACWGDYDMWIVKVDSAGNYQWDKRYGSPSLDDARSVCLTHDGGYLLGGQSIDNTGGDKSSPGFGGSDYWVVRIDSAGNYLWDRSFGGTSFEDLKTVIENPDHSFMLCGQSYSGLGGNKSQPSWGEYDYWIVKIDSIGNKIWDKRLGTTSYDYFGSATSDGGTGFFAAGYSSGGISGDRSVSNLGTYDYWLLHVDSAGNKIWDNCFGGDNEDSWVSTLIRSANGNLMMVGNSATNINGNKTQQNLGVYQCWMIECDSAGHPLFDRTLRDHSSDYGFGSELNDGCFVLGNNSDANGGGDKSSSSWCNSYDFFIAKYCVPLPVAAFTGDSVICKGSCTQFHDLSQNYPQSWQWLFPGGLPSVSTDPNPVVCYSDTGSFDVKLIVTNVKGNDTVWHYACVTVEAPPDPFIFQNGDTLFCTSSNVNFQWYLNGNTISGATSSYFVAIQSGTYSVVVSDPQGCTSTSSVYIEIIGPLFSSADSTICKKLCTEFSDLSNNNPISWQWEFEGGSPPTSNAQNPEVCYNNEGTFSVTLITFNGSEFDTLFLPDFITVFPTPVQPFISISGNTLTSTTAYAYQWLLDSIPIPGATNQSFVATQSGVYTVITSNDAGCYSQVSIQFFLSSVGNNPQINPVSIFPNPTDGKFGIDFGDNDMGPCEVEIYDAFCHLVLKASIFANMNSPEVSLNIGNNPSGVYLVRILHQEKYFSAIIVKN